MVKCLNCYLRQARLLIYYYSNLLVFEMLKISSPNISLDMLVSFILTKKNVCLAFVPALCY